MAITLRNLSIILVGALLATGCSQLSSEDRALLIQTQSTANDAKAEATRAANAAQQSAEQARAAAADARAANEKADRMFSRSQRKTRS
ncbi:alanine-zipper protein [Azospirillum sp. CT11-132]|uniref:alanine-zipper protein n=1 Tax=Azospirillum sp. CT11-132 TaxID=3396317 RepID=UPI0039A53D04